MWVGIAGGHVYIEGFPVELWWWHTNVNERIGELNRGSHFRKQQPSSWEVLNLYTIGDHCVIVWVVSPGWSTNDLETFILALDDRTITADNATEKASNTMKRVTEACGANLPQKSLLSEKNAWEQEGQHSRFSNVSSKRR